MADNKENKSNFVEDNNIFIYGLIDETFAKDIIAPLVKLIKDQESKSNPEINIHVNTNGGFTKMAYATIDLIEIAKTKGIIVKTYVDAEACSAGSLIAIAGSKGDRYISDYGYHYCHLGRVDGINVSTDMQLQRSTMAAKYHFSNIRKLYKKYCNIPELDEKLKDDQYSIYPKDCIKWGLSDYILY